MACAPAASRQCIAPRRVRASRGTLATVNICSVREVATELKYQPFLAEGIVKCTNLRVVDASGNRALADVLLGCLLVHQERYLRGARKRRLERVAADEVAAAAALPASALRI
jgi:hypothetical protein